MKRFFYPLNYVLAFCIISLSFTANVLAEKDYSIKYSWGEMQIPENLSEFVTEKISAEEITQGMYYRYVQFYEIPSNGVRKQLEQNGLHFLAYLPTNTYIVAIPSIFDKNILTNYNIRSVVGIQPNGKKHKNLVTETFPEWAMVGTSDIQLVMSHYENLNHQLVIDQLQALNVSIVTEYSDLRNITVQIPVNNIDEFASLPFIQSIEVLPPAGEPEDYEARSLHRSNNVNSFSPMGYKYDGTDVSIAVNDDGFVGPHIDFTGRIDNSEVATDFTGTHGDGVAGVAAAAGNLNPRNMGAAPGAFLKIRQYDSGLPGVIALHTNEDIMIFNSSYSNGTNAGYTNVTVQVDDEIYDYPSLLQTFSAGNSNGGGSTSAGSQWFNITGGHKAGKNCITTANLFWDDALVNSSSRGPASDGRLKPDIAANGQNQISNDPNNQYQTFGGTSAAAPSVMGCTAQLYHAYKDLNGGQDPESPLIKAAILNTAYDLGNSGPDFKYGWGRINTLRALRLIEDVRYMSDTISQGATNTHSIVIPADVAQVKVMLYWLDPAGTTVASKALVNDLNARLFSPANDTVLPLILDPTPNATLLDLPAVEGVDDLNNVEQIRFDNPAAGTYTFEVNGLTVPFGPQKYYVVYTFETSDIEVTYPEGGEGFSPGQIEVIRWDAFADSSTFDLDYSIDDGTTWNSIVTGVNGNTRHYAWNPPSSVTSEALVRVTRDGVSDESNDNFTIIGIPNGINFGFACPDSFQVVWNPVGNALGYEVSLLGNMYMDSVGYTTGTSFVISGVNPVDEYWVSVRALESNGGYGERANAVLKTPGVFNCILAVDGSMSNLVSPGGFSAPDCQSGSSIDLTVEITNSGANAISNFPAYYSVNGGTPVMETVTSTIPAGGTLTYPFTSQPALAGVGTYSIQTWVDITNDANQYNDTITFDYEVFGSSTVLAPFFDNLETFNNCNTSTDCEQTNCTLANNWYNETNGEADDIDWRTDNGGTPSNNTGPSIDHNPGNAGGNFV
ncbi:MAG: S8 family serine peptidase, partial [Bacteroidia bacterium]|nr:S8 family serine peptidase [Bacteroidia bacterium]